MTHCLRYESGCDRVSKAIGWHQTKALPTFDGRIIFIDKVALDELDCEARFAHATSANHHKLVLAEELRQSMSMAQSSQGQRWSLPWKPLWECQCWGRGRSYVSLSTCVALVAIVQKEEVGPQRSIHEWNQAAKSDVMKGLSWSFGVAMDVEGRWRVLWMDGVGELGGKGEESRTR